MLDCLVIVPFEPTTSPMLDPQMRSTYLAKIALPLESATGELENFLGLRLDYWEPNLRPTIAGRELAFPRTRTLSAVVLASALEHSGLRWHALDPGVQELGWWRRALRRMRPVSPRTIAVCTTFILHYPWLATLCGMIRRTLPDTKLLIGGYYYGSNAKNFLSLDGDVFCVGEGEERLPAIVRAYRDGGAVDHIPGLYVRRPDGSLHHTGHVEPINFRKRPPVDWALAARIEPPLDLDRDLVEVGVETQRGCIFKCEFCSYRTLNQPTALTPDEAVEAIMQTGVVHNAAINIVDATATFPHERWNAVLRGLVARGGAPHPLWAFARVTDINEDSARLMAAAGVQHLFVGQESGDQRILDLMKKGTRVTHAKGAIEALARHGVSATFGFIHGFPGETAETIEATRRMIEGLNLGFETRPPILTYLLYPFTVYNFAQVADRSELKDVGHYMDYDPDSKNRDLTFAAVLETIVRTSRIPHAPAFSHLFLKSGFPSTGASMISRTDKTALFHWLKAVERGVAIFLERALEGRPVNDCELENVRRVILAAYPTNRQRPGWFMRNMGKLAFDRLQREWRGETKDGAGLLTRAIVGASVLQNTRNVELGWRAWRTGDLLPGESTDRTNGAVGSHAADLIAHARTTPGKYPKEALPRTTG